MAVGGGGVGRGVYLPDVVFAADFCLVILAATFGVGGCDGDGSLRLALFETGDASLVSDAVLCEIFLAVGGVAASYSYSKEGLQLKVFSPTLD